MRDGARGGYGQRMGVVNVVRRDFRVHVREYAVAIAMMAVAMVALVTRIDVQDQDTSRFRADTWWSWAIPLAICATLAGSRRWPLLAFAAGLVLMAPLELGHHRDSVAFFALVIALFSVAAHCALRDALKAVAMLGALYAVLHVNGTTIISSARLVGVMFFATGFVFGRVVQYGRARQQREAVAALQRAATSAEMAALKGADERLRIAQELHDVVAHSLSVIAVQAGIGVHLIDRAPTEAARALDAIRSTSRTATDELNRLVLLLREGRLADHTLAPTINELSVLVDQVRAAGIPVTLTIFGDLDTVPAGISLAAYRITQEALTNVVRHAGRAHATVTVRATDDQVELSIDDDGHGVTTTLDERVGGGGHGLIGMGERAEMYGGELRAGPRPGGGFRVCATLRRTESSHSTSALRDPDVGVTSVPIAATRSRRFPTWTGDVMLTALMVALASVEITTSDSTRGSLNVATHLWAWMLRIGCCLTIVFRRRFPTTAFTASCLLYLFLAIGDYRVGVVTFALWIGLYSVVNYAVHRRAALAVLGTYSGLGLIAWSKPPELTTLGVAWIGVLSTAVAVVGVVLRHDREVRTTDLAERERSVEAETRRDRLAVTNERLRIADELGAIISFSIRTISLEAGDGSDLVRTDPDEARKILAKISTTSRDALNDLRSLLKRLRTETMPIRYAPIVVDPVDMMEVGEAR